MSRQSVFNISLSFCSRFQETSIVHLAYLHSTTNYLASHSKNRRVQGVGTFSVKTQRFRQSFQSRVPIARNASICSFARREDTAFLGERYATIGSTRIPNSARAADNVPRIVSGAIVRACSAHFQKPSAGGIVLKDCSFRERIRRERRFAAPSLAVPCSVAVRFNR